MNHLNLSAMPRQRGVVLVVAMILLVIISLLGISAIRTVALEEKMGAAAYDRGLAFQAAESALRVAEEDLLDRASGTKPAKSDGNCTPATLIAKAVKGYISQTDIDCNENWVADPTVTAALWTKYAKEAVASNNMGTLAGDPPTYIIEYLTGEAPCEPRDPTSTNKFCHQFRITAKASPGAGRADVMLQSIYFTR